METKEVLQILYDNVCKKCLQEVELTWFWTQNEEKDFYYSCNGCFESSYDKEDICL